MRFSSPNSVTVNPVGGSNFNVTNINSGASFGFASESAALGLQSAHEYGASIVGTAAAGNKAIAELNNPAASGKTLYVYSLDMFVPVAMAVNLFLDGTTLNPVGTGPNLNIGGAAGVAKVGGGNQLAPTGTLVYTSPSLTANVDYLIPQPWIVAIPQGHNIQLIGQVVNQAFTCNVRWLEY